MNHIASLSPAMSAITLDQLLALNEEIAALVRAGVPLEKNLGHLGGEMPGKLGDIAAMIAERAAQGRIARADHRRTIGRVPARLSRGHRSRPARGPFARRVGIARRHGPPIGRNPPRRDGFRLISAVRADFDLVVLRDFHRLDRADALRFLQGVERARPGVFPRIDRDGKIRQVLGTGGTDRDAAFGRLVLVAIEPGDVDRRPRHRPILRKVAVDRHDDRQFAQCRFHRNVRHALVASKCPMHEALVLAADSAGSSQLRTAVRQAAENLQAGPFAWPKATAWPPFRRFCAG